MRARRYSMQLGAFLLVVSLQTGCGVGRQLAENVVIHPLEWNRYSDALGRHLRDKSLAEEAWDEICARDGDIYSRHYRRGFFDGFNDYLDGGGTGEPPVAPPSEKGCIETLRRDRQKTLDKSNNDSRRGSPCAG